MACILGHMTTMHPIPLLFSLAAILGIAAPGRAATVTDFAKTFTVTVPAGLADEPLSDFPLLVRLGSGIQGFDYADFRQNGADILVTDTEDHPLPIELENWNTNGESRLWVQVPSVAEGTTIRVYSWTASPRPATKARWPSRAASSAAPAASRRTASTRPASSSPRRAARRRTPPTGSARTSTPPSGCGPARRRRISAI